MRRAMYLPLTAALLLAACGGEDPAPDGAARPAAISAAPPVAATGVADAIYVDGRGYTVDERGSWAQSFAVRDGRFMAVGSNEEIQALAGPDTDVIVLGGRMVLPGIHDMHAHVAQAGTKELFECGFPFTLPVPEILARVETCVANAPPGAWLRGGQWAMELMGSDTIPHRHLLDGVAPDTPVLLLDSTVHGAWVNSRGLEVLGIDKDTPDPVGGVIVRDLADGEPTGILIDNAAYNALYALPAWSPQQMEQALAWGIAQMNAMGVTAVKDAMVDRATLGGYAGLDRKGQLNAHVATSLPWRMAWAGPQEALQATIDGRHKLASPNLRVDFIKIMLDGIPPSRTAAVLEPYLEDGKPFLEDRGYLTQPAEQLAEDLVQLDAAGLTVKIHATGDRSVRVALDAFEAARKANGNSGLRHEVAHAEMISPDDLPRFKSLGVTAEMSPILWYPSPLHVAMESVLGAERAGRFWPIRTLNDTGALVIYGSDWPSVVPSPSPWPGIEAMVTRRDPYGANEDTLGPGEALSLVQVLRIFTRNGADAMYHTDSTGSIEPGKHADFIVIDRNLFAISPEQIGETVVLRTVFRGRTVFVREYGPSGVP